MAQPNGRWLSFVHLVVQYPEQKKLGELYSPTRQVYLNTVLCNLYSTVFKFYAAIWMMQICWSNDCAMLPSCPTIILRRYFITPFLHASHIFIEQLSKSVNLYRITCTVLYYVNPTYACRNKSERTSSIKTVIRVRYFNTWYVGSVSENRTFSSNLQSFDANVHYEKYAWDYHSHRDKIEYIYTNETL